MTRRGRATGSCERAQEEAQDTSLGYLESVSHAGWSSGSQRGGRTPDPCSQPLSVLLACTQRTNGAGLAQVWGGGGEGGTRQRGREGGGQEDEKKFGCWRGGRERQKGRRRKVSTRGEEGKTRTDLC